MSSVFPTNVFSVQRKVVCDMQPTVSQPTSKLPHQTTTTTGAIASAHGGAGPTSVTSLC